MIFLELGNITDQLSIVTENNDNELECHVHVLVLERYQGLSFQTQLIFIILVTKYLFMILN